MGILGLRHEREPAAGLEAVVLQRLLAERRPRKRHDTDPLVLPPDRLPGRSVPEVKTSVGPLEPEAKPLAQNARSRCAASTTRSTDGMYASSICQYGYGTS
jgi:hypothetical protein